MLIKKTARRIHYIHPLWQWRLTSSSPENLPELIHRQLVFIRRLIKRYWTKTAWVWMSVFFLLAIHSGCPSNIDHGIDRRTIFNWFSILAILCGCVSVCVCVGVLHCLGYSGLNGPDACALFNNPIDWPMMKNWFWLLGNLATAARCCVCVCVFICAFWVACNRRSSIVINSLHVEILAGLAVRP